ncbi:MAG: endonuclease [Bacteroidales bacterium]|nr:endonuclease [Bacteroidales bacterium]
MVKDIVAAYASCLLMLIFTGSCFSQVPEQGPVRLMFYNVENLFDIADDSLKEDNDFLPGGVMKWNYSRYNRKIVSLYKTIVAAGSWSPPDIVSFCEVENRQVMEDLVYGTYLAKFDYWIIHEDSPDQRGIDVCLIYRADRLTLIDFRYWTPEGMQKDDFITRSVLCARFSFQGDTFHLIVNHWPSRRGGTLAGEKLRSKIAGMVQGKSDSIIGLNNAGGKVIIVGDFNCTPDGNEIRTLVDRGSKGKLLTDLSGKMAEDGLGTYRYRGTWEMIDQVIVSEALLASKHGLYTKTSMLTIFSPEFLLKKDPKYPGKTPFSTYLGYRYQGGFSDHLPVLLDLGFR